MLPRLQGGARSVCTVKELALEGANPKGKDKSLGGGGFSWGGLEGCGREKFGEKAHLLPGEPLGPGGTGRRKSRPPRWSLELGRREPLRVLRD